MTIFHLSYLLLWALALVLALASVVLLYLLAQLQTRSDRSWVGYEARFLGRELTFSSAKDLRSGQEPASRPFRSRTHVVLILSPNCGSCSSLISELKSEPQNEIGGVPLLLLCTGEFERCKAAVTGVHLAQVLALNGRDDATKSILLLGSPTAVVVNEAGIVVDIRHSASYIHQEYRGVHRETEYEQRIRRQ